MSRLNRVLPLCTAAAMFTASWSLAAQPDPSDPAASVPALEVPAALAGYRPARENPLAGWKDVHREVLDAGTGGGHAGHGSAASSPPQPTPSATTPPGVDDDPHAGHRTNR